MQLALSAFSIVSNPVTASLKTISNWPPMKRQKMLDSGFIELSQYLSHVRTESSPEYLFITIEFSFWELSGSITLITYFRMSGISVVALLTLFFEYFSGLPYNTVF